MTDTLLASIQPTAPRRRTITGMTWWRHLFGRICGWKSFISWCYQMIHHTMISHPVPIWGALLWQNATFLSICFLWLLFQGFPGCFSCRHVILARHLSNDNRRKAAQWREDAKWSWHGGVYKTKTLYATKQSRGSWSRVHSEQVSTNERVKLLIISCTFNSTLL